MGGSGDNGTLTVNTNHNSKYNYDLMCVINGLCSTGVSIGVWVDCSMAEV